VWTISLGAKRKSVPKMILTTILEEEIETETERERERERDGKFENILTF